MKKHPYHDLWMHDDDELSKHIGTAILNRRTIHEWPLSCVQIVDLEDGEKRIYKSQFGPTVESEFYAQAKSPLLPQAETLFRENGHSCMLLEFIDAPHVRDLTLSPREGLAMCNALMSELRRIEGTPPCYLDVSSPEKWRDVVGATLEDLLSLIDTGQFSQTTRETVAALEQCALSETVVSATQADVGLVHSDPSGDNVFVLPQGFRVIDWQRPKRGPRDFDKVAFLHCLGLDPLEHVEPGVVAAWYFLCAYWPTQCKKRWIPDAQSYDGAIVSAAGKIKKALE